MRGKDKAGGNEIGEWRWRGAEIEGIEGGIERRWEGEGGGHQQSLTLPWKLVYALLMDLVDPIRDSLCPCLHRHRRVYPGSARTRTNTQAHACVRDNICALTHTCTQTHKNKRMRSFATGKTSKLVREVGQRIPRVLLLIGPRITTSPPLGPSSPPPASDNGVAVTSRPPPRPIRQLL